MIWDDSIDKKDWLINSGIWELWDYETYKNVNHYDVIIVNRLKDIIVSLFIWCFGMKNQELIEKMGKHA